MKDDELKNEEVTADIAPEEEDIVEFEYNADGEEDLKATLKKLRKDLKTEKTKSQEYLTNWQRERADFLNYKKDDTARLGRVKEVATEKLIEELLPVLDAYDIAFSNKEAWEKVEKNWRMGVEYIHAQLLKVLADYGVSEIAPKEGSAIDHNLHEAIEVVDATDESQDQTIAKIVQKGYKNSDRVIRPARVHVFEYKK